MKVFAIVVFAILGALMLFWCIKSLIDIINLIKGKKKAKKEKKQKEDNCDL